MTATEQLEIAELRRELRRSRVCTYKIALLIGLVGAIPVYLLRESAPWVIVIPIFFGAILNVVIDLRASRTKKVGFSGQVREVFVVQISESFYTVPHLVAVAGIVSPSIDPLVKRQRFEAQAREVDRGSGRLTPCYA